MIAKWALCVITKTKTVNLLLGNMACNITTARIDCQGALNVISNPDPNQSDALYPVFTNTTSTCYSPGS